MFIFWTHSPAWTAVGWSMIHFLWIGFLIGLAAFAGRFLLRRCAPNVRYAFLAVCLLLLTLTPLTVFLRIMAFGETEPMGETSFLKEDIHHQTKIVSLTENPSMTVLSRRNEPSLIASNQFIEGLHHTWRSGLHNAADWAPWIWLGGMPIVAALFSLGLIETRGLRRNCQFIEEGWLKALSDRASRALDMGRAVVIAAHEKVTSPLLVGVIKPIIVLPPSLVSGCTVQQMEMILLHELAHVRRLDPLFNLIQRIVECALFFHPMIWIVSRWIREEREVCCDEIVLRSTNRPLDYAETLVFMASKSGQIRLSSALPMARHPLVRRINRILRMDEPAISNRPMLFAGITALLLAGFAVAVGSAQKTQPEPQRSEVKTLHFPEDRIVGSVLIRPEADFSGDLKGTFDGWQRWARAQGKVTIPKGHQAQLQVNRDAAASLEFLDRLRPDDLYFLNLWLCGVDDSNIRHVGRMSGLRALDLTHASVSDRTMEVVGKLNRLRFLALSFAPIGDEGLSQLTSLGDLEFLRLNGCGFTDQGLVHLSKLTGLKGLQLRQNDITSAGLAHLIALTNLRHLAFGRGNRIDDDGLIHLSNLTSLEYLSLQHQPLSDEGLKALIPLRSLKTLYLDKTPITDDGMANLRELPALQELTVPERINSEGWSRLAGHPALRYLNASTDAHLAQAAKFPALTALGIGKECTDTGMRSVSKMAKLEVIFFNNNQITDQGLAKLAGLKAIRQLHLNNTEATDEGLAVLKELPALEEVFIYRLRGGLEGLRHLAHLNSLRSLHLDFEDPEAFSDKTLEPISSLRGLRDLNLTGPVTNRGMTQLSALKRLESLTLKQTKLTDDGLTNLIHFPKLTALRLEGRFTDKAIEHLAGIVSLDTLSLGGDTRISRAGKARLAALPSMQYLELPGNAPNGNRVEVGDLAPDFQATTLKGKPFRLQDYRGKSVLLHFYGTWTGPGGASVPKLKRLQNELGAHPGFQMVNLSFAEPEFMARAHAERHDLTWPQIALGWNSKVTRDYGVVGAPAWFLVGPDGKLRSTTGDLEKIKDLVARAIASKDF